jgi:mannosylglycoprotein endo-beta-mannosidase
MQGNNVSGHRNVLNTFATHLRQKYEPIEIDQTCVTRLQGVIPFTCPTKYADLLEQPITIEELSATFRSEAKHQTPGIDGFNLEFYIANWDAINHDLLELVNQMFLHKKITPEQKHGIIVCLPKSNGDRTQSGYRPISLLTTAYKLLARIMARRLRHVLKDHLHKSQFCGVPGNSILEAASLV